MTVWWQKAVVYQVYPRSFQDSNGDGIGDLQGVLQHIDYIKKLGADVVWLNPVYRSPNDDNGYDISDYQQIQPDFGTLADLRAVIDACHQNGLRLMMDLVVNHTSDEHDWFVASRTSREDPFHDFYIWREGRNGNPPTNWRSEFGGSVWQYDPQVDQYYLHMFTKKQPDLNWRNPKVRQKVFDMMDWWCQQGIDGFRMDVINLISKPEPLTDDPHLTQDARTSSLGYVANGPHAHEYLQAMNQQVLRRYPLMTVGETPDVTPDDAIKYAGFDRGELQMVFQFEHMQLENDPVVGKWTTNRASLPALKAALSRWQTALDGKAWNSLYWNNHDQPRVVSRFGNDLAEYRELSAKMLANTLHMMQGTPYIYQGEEIGMTNVAFADIRNYRDVEIKNTYRELVEETKTLTPAQMKAAIEYRGRDNARTPMQWRDAPNAGFTTGTPWLGVNPNYPQINVDAALMDPNSIFYFYQRLIQLRKDYPIITDGHYALLDPDDEAVFMYTRTLGDQQLLMVSNFTDQTLQRPVAARLGTQPEGLISNYPAADVDTLRPYETRTYLSTVVG
ncbi:glycoside hydrolase family 13 protein [Lacticaseibacillus absianus]|uniref:glycoside hydrolase family 13 protein n=1 Tax=Lacticaseibacillus absianus TaxID=2729623 RepID=UPI0015C858AD|nr:alpha-glucosidase [Lacticaseibacillus absianus]